MRKRNDTIDILKGIGIILMVAGHCDAPLKKFIYLFHMSIFFIASGYCYNAVNSSNFESVKKYVVRKIKTLYVPYICTKSVLYLLQNMLIKLNVYVSNKEIIDYVTSEKIIFSEYWSVTRVLKNIISCFFFAGEATPLAGALWFLATLLEISVIYCFIDYGVKKNLTGKNIHILKFVISLLFLGIGYYCNLKKISLYGFNRFFTCFIFYYIGSELRRLKILELLNSKKKDFIVFILSISLLLICFSAGDISLNVNQYHDPFILILASISGWCLIWELSKYINKMTRISSTLIYIGQNTLFIVLFHFVAFKFVNFLQVIIFNKPIFLIGAFPTLYTEKLWWIIYIMCGIGVPLYLRILINKIMEHMKKEVIR